MDDKLSLLTNCANNEIEKFNHDQLNNLFNLLLILIWLSFDN